MNKKKSIITVVFFSVLLFSISAMCYFSPQEEYTNSERRSLMQMPDLSSETVQSGEFMKEFEKFTADQFPFRDNFRTIKALFSKYVLNKKENNGLFTACGHLSKLDDELNVEMLDYSANLFRSIYEKNIEGTNSNVYFSIVPDKNYFLTKENGYPSMDYAELYRIMCEKTEDFMEYIPINHLLSEDDYFKTDSHWKQENIVDVAEAIAEKMSADIKTEYEIKTLENPFYGVYAGQSALPIQPDTIKYLTNDVLENCVVTYYDTGKPEIRDMYNMEKAYGKDPYEMFLSGVAPLIEIDNPYSETEKELVIFRDSFGSSLAPLFVEGYSKVTIVDIRYVQSAFISNFVKFDKCDVLFIYSTSLLNNSLSMK